MGEVLLLLKLFNKYNGMYNILKMVKIIKNKVELFPILKLILRKYISFVLKKTFDLKDQKMIFWTLGVKKNKKIGSLKNTSNNFYKNILLKKNHKYLAKNKYYASFKTDFNLKKKNNHSIFVIGEVFEYYNGSI